MYRNVNTLTAEQGCGLGLNASVSRPPRGVPTPRLGLASVSAWKASCTSLHSAVFILATCEITDYSIRFCNAIYIKNTVIGFLQGFM